MGFYIPNIFRYDQLNVIAITPRVELFRHVNNIPKPTFFLLGDLPVNSTGNPFLYAFVLNDGLSHFAAHNQSLYLVTIFLAVVYVL